MKKKILYTLTALALAAPAGAQLNSSVSVEGEYQPLVIETERIGAFPLGFKYELPAANLDYEYAGVVADFKPGLLSMGVTGRQTGWPFGTRRGFIDLNAGSYLNTRLHAGCNILNDSRQSLTAELKFESSTLWRSHGLPEGFTRLPRKRLYDGTLSLGYSRLIGPEGLLEAGASYRVAYFNYYGTTVERALLSPGIARPAIPTQTLNQAKAAVGFSSSPSNIRGWHAEAAVDFTAYRRLYGPVLEGAASAGDRETILSAGAGYAFNFAETSAIALDAGGDFIFYANPQNTLLPTPDRRNYGIITLKPAYRFAGETLTIRAGADIAISYDAMGTAPGEKFGSLHAAPNAEIAYRSPGGIGVTLSATGGVAPSTLLLREQFDRYQMPRLLSTQPVFTPLDARLALNAGPFAGFDASVALRYVAAKNVPLGGWYQAYLGSFFRTHGLPGPLYTDPYSQSASLHGLSVDLALGYCYGTMVEVKFDGSYTPQKGKRGIFNGFDRPRWVLAASAAVRPVKKLKIEVGYDYRGVRHCYALTTGARGPELTGRRLADITDLNARITYSVLSNLDIYCSGANLLNCRPDFLPGLQTEGIVISGGFYLTF